MARNAILQVRNNTAEYWSSSGIILAPGEFGQEIDTGRLKIGNGSSSWSELRYVNGSVTTSETPPENPMEGDQWFEADTTRMYVYYDSYWVEASSPVSAVGQLDGGGPFTNYGGIAPINAGGI